MSSTAPATPFKRVAAFLLTLLTLFTLNANALTVTASAANTNTVGIVWQSGYSVRNRTSSFNIKGNYWSKRTITIVGDFLPNIVSVGDKENTFKKAAQFTAEHARFSVTVTNSKGNRVASYSGLRFGSSFKLPQWSTQTYTITVTGSFNSYNGRNIVQQYAAYYGKYHLKY